jgi:class 3 adenylate cyclase
VAKLQKRNLGAPDELRSVGRGRLELVEMGDAAFGRITYEPGWRWSQDLKPLIGTDWCEIHHVGYCVSGSLRAEMRDGSSMEIGGGDIFEVPPGHDAWVVGDEPWVSVDWTGRRFFGKPPDTTSQRVLATILFTDIVGSTQVASQLGDQAWRDRLAQYHAMTRRALEHYRGREIATTGDGILATFDSPARAVRCALETAAGSRGLDLEQRAGLHTGEVEYAGEDVRGVAVHLAARVAAAAGADEVFVSPITNGLLVGSGIPTLSRGNHSLKGIDQPVELFEVTGGTGGSATT